ncbi:tRNA-dihydrouridine(20a/20b) synthase [NAD(P)+]-like [Hetaerina americana]|uniref:tRNA-dihydrouridine(20a/20b) synthase [NAD(P)+]-like n=1 Tax=Hetaerina americana TaxID=62018 RepID=UPI003A7F2976
MKRCDISELFQEKTVVKMCAPMVRYSKLPFRMLVREYDTDVCFTPMIMSDSFVQSQKARDNEFKTCEGDRPLIVQFAANNVEDFLRAAELVSPYSDGVDLNCGCPQRWAIKEGYGSSLLKNPELVRDIVLRVRNTLPSPYSVSVKIRLLDEHRETLSLCQSLEAAGVTFITVHARTPAQRRQPPNYEALQLLCSSLNIPVVANGDIHSLQVAKEVALNTGCKGVMTARGILENPALYAGCESTPVECVKRWVTLCLSLGSSFNCFHRHLSLMTGSSSVGVGNSNPGIIRNPMDRRFLNCLTTYPAVIDFFSREDIFGNEFLPSF